MSLTAEEVATLDEGLPADDPSAESAAEDEQSGTPEQLAGESADPAAPSAPEAEAEGADGDSPTKKETAEQKAAREKEEAIAKRWQLVERAKKAQLDVAKKEQAVAADREKLAQERQSFAVERQTHARELGEARRALAMLEQVRTSPTIEGLRSLGFDYRDLTRQMVEANTPEAIARQTQTEIQQLRAQQQHEREIAATRADARELARIVDDEGDAFPTIANYPPERIAQEGISLRDRYRREHGSYPSYDWVLQTLEKDARAFEDARKARAEQRTAGKKSETASTPNNGTGTQAKQTPTGKPTLTPTAASARVSPPREMTEEEKDQAALAALRDLYAGKGRAPARQ